MIQVSDLEYRYGASDFLLKIPELSVRCGERVAIVGPSGSGKTTLLLLLSGAKLPHRGSISVAGTSIHQLPDSARRRFRAANIGFVFQDFGLIDYLTVRENILLPYWINTALRLNSDVRTLACSLADAAGLGSKLARRPNQLSHGECQRVALCRAMVTRPSILLADEPTGSLDRHSADEVLDMLFAHGRQNGTTLLLVTHDLTLLDKFDRTINLAHLDVPASNREGT